MLTTSRTIALLLTGSAFAGACLAQQQEPAKAPESELQFYKLEFVVKEVEGEKVVNSRNYTTNVSTRNSTSIRAGSRVPYNTGTPTARQFQYYDVGVNIDCRSVRILSSGQLSLDVNVDVSSVILTNEGSSDLVPPMVRNNKWASGVIVPLKRPTNIYSSDDPSGNRKMRVELTATPIS